MAQSKGPAFTQETPLVDGGGGDGGGGEVGGGGGFGGGGLFPLLLGVDAPEGHQTIS